MSSSPNGAAALEKRPLTRRDLHFYVNTLIIELTKKEFQDTLKDESRKEPIPQTGEELLDRFDEIQAEFFSKVPLKVPVEEEKTAEGEAAPAAPSAAETATTKTFFCDGDDVVAQIKMAAQTFPDKDTERLLMRMCTALEAQVYAVSTAVPELHQIAQQMGHETATMGHGHSHDHGHNHNHSHDHGHSHNGMATPTPEMMRMMEMAMGTLNPEQRETLDRVQKTMESGSPPSADDMKKMFAVQQHIMAFMKTMEQFMGGGASAAPAGRKS